jgi:hypothetical protein
MSGYLPQTGPKEWSSPYPAMKLAQELRNNVKQLINGGQSTDKRDLFLRYGRITATAYPTCTVTVGSDPTPIANVVSLASYFPVVGDIVAILQTDKNQLLVLGPAAPGLGWTSYTPVINTDTGNVVTFNDGFITGRYKLVGAKTMLLRFAMDGGTTGGSQNGGNGQWRFNLPSGYTLLDTNQAGVFNGFSSNLNNGNFHGTLEPYDSTHLRFRVPQDPCSSPPTMIDQWLRNTDNGGTTAAGFPKPNNPNYVYQGGFRLQAFATLELA